MMCFHVRLEIASQRELLVTFGAGKRLGASMREQMILHVGEFGEAAVANVASERPCAIVRMHVTLEVARSRKRL